MTEVSAGRPQHVREPSAGDAVPPSPTPLVRRWHRLQAVALFVRLSASGATVLICLLGAASASPHLPAPDVLRLGALAAGFHLFAYLLNDVVDLPLDRTEPRRALSPLVRGVVPPGLALAIALAQVPLSLILVALGPGAARATAALTAAFALMAVYDLVGKRTPTPWLLDLVQGLGWGALLLCGAATRGAWTLLTWVLFAFVTIYIVMVNGVHGALRDLDNDHHRGVRSTAVAMGARVDGGGRLVVPRRMRLYTWALQLVLVGLALLPPVLGEPEMGMVPRSLTGAALLVLAVLTCGLANVALSAGDTLALRYAGSLHLIVVITLPAVAVFPALDRGFALLLLAGFALPLLALGWFPEALRWAWRRRVGLRCVDQGGGVT